MYTIEIIHLKEKHMVALLEAFDDRDITLRKLPMQYELPGIVDIRISNIHPITMTPLMWWILHHIDISDYRSIIIS